MMTQQTLVTGMGVVAPTGLSTEEYWTATLSAESAIAPLKHLADANYAANLAGCIPDFDPRKHLPGRLLPQTDRVTQLALVASEVAITDAELSVSDMESYACGVMTSNATGGFEYSHREMQKLWQEGPDAVSVYQCFAWFYAANTGQISIRHGMRGPGGVMVSEQAGGLDAIGNANRLIRRGRAEAMLTGGAESSFDPWGWISHLSSGLISSSTDPSGAYLPFDRRSNGYVPGEGGAILLLEDAASAKARSVPRVYGRITGYASTFDPPPSSNRPSGLRRAATGALTAANLRPDEIDLVLADAAGTPALDQEEADALAHVFGARSVAVTAPKAAVGRLMAGAAPLDVVCALLAIRDNVVPCTPNVSEVVDDYGLDLVVGEPRDQRVDAVLVLARGSGGFNSAMVVQRA